MPFLDNHFTPIGANARSGSITLPGSVFNLSAFMILAGGDNYRVNDQLKIEGTGQEAIIQVSSISGGGSTGPVTGLSIVFAGAYTISPFKATGVIPKPIGTTSGHDLRVNFTVNEVSPLTALHENSHAMYRYSSADPLNQIIKFGYFNELRGYLKRGDWVYVDSSVGGTLVHSILFVNRDGFERNGIEVHPFTDTVVAGGTGYSDGDLIQVNLTPAADVISKPIIQVTDESAGVVTEFTIIDPGLFKTLPTVLTPVATTKITGNGNDDLTITVAGFESPEHVKDIWLVAKIMSAA